MTNLDTQPEAENPIDADRESFGDRLNSVVDTTGNVVNTGAEIGKTVVKHGVDVGVTLGSIAGTVAGGAVRLFKSTSAGYRRGRGKTSSDLSA